MCARLLGYAGSRARALSEVGVSNGATPRRTPIVAGNWKMYYGPSEAQAFAESILADLNAVHGVERVLCPPAISIPAVHNVVSGSEVTLGAQNMYFEEKGAYTGETSPLMLCGLCEYVILGHSERRGYFGETDELVNKKALAAFAHGLKPIVCVGERLEDRDAGLTERVITGQVRGSLANLPPEHVAELVVAYEPIWAIGTGRAATPEGANATIGLIRRTLADVAGASAAEAIRIQYGGSVTAENFGAFIAQPEIDGALVGGASLRADQFIEIVRLAAEQAG
jgi:triosephosphate isomerase